MLLIALALLVGIGLGGRWILTRHDALTVQDESAAHIGYVGRDDRQIYLSLDLLPVVNVSEDPVRLTKAELLPAARPGGTHWIRATDVRVLAEGTETPAASGLWPEQGGQATEAPSVAGHTLPPGERIRLVFIVRLPDLKRTDDLSLSMSRSWSTLRVEYDEGGDPKTVEAHTSIDVCIPNQVACQNG